MLSKLLLAALLVLPGTVVAESVQYALTFTPYDSTSPSGTGSFFWDEAAATVQNFSWNFEGDVGSAGNFSATSPAENISYAIVEITADHIVAFPRCSGCTIVLQVQSGEGPLGATTLALADDTGAAGGEFRWVGVNPQVDFAGRVFAAPVPLPAAAWLMLSGLGALGAFARRRQRALAAPAA